MYDVGIDVHQRTSSLCVLNSQGKQVLARTVPGHWSRLGEALAEVPRPFAVCFEASTAYGALYELFSREAQRVAVAHPGQLRLIFRAKRKNDRVDAQKLALLLMLDQVPEIHVPGADTRQWRRLIRLRCRLIADRTRTKNRIRNMLRQHGIEAPRALWTQRGLSWLAQLEFALEPAAIERDLLLDDLAQHNQRIKRLEAQLNKIAAAHPGVALLRTIPGVGIRTAEAFVAWVDAPRRFGTHNAIGSYLGLVPSQDASRASTAWATSPSRAPARCGSSSPRPPGRPSGATRSCALFTNACAEGTANDARSPSWPWPTGWPNTCSPCSSAAAPTSNGPHRPSTGRRVLAGVRRRASVLPNWCIRHRGFE